MKLYQIVLGNASKDYKSLIPSIPLLKLEGIFVSNIHTFQHQCLKFFPSCHATMPYCIPPRQSRLEYNLHSFQKEHTVQKHLMFDVLTGEVLMDEVKIELDEKFEGLEFVNIYTKPKF